MENRRYKKKTESDEGKCDPALSDEGTTTESVLEKKKTRERQPFFPEDEEVPYVLLEESISQGSKTKKNNRANRSIHKGRQFKPISQKEVGTITLPIGVYPSTVDQLQSNNTELEEELKDLEIKPKQNKTVKNFFDNLTEPRNRYSGQETLSDRQASSSILSSSVTSNQYERMNYRMEMAPKPPEGIKSPSREPPTKATKKVTNPLDILRSLSGSNKKMGKENNQQCGNSKEDKLASESKRLKSILKGMGMLPAIQVEPEEQPRAYAFPKYVCSPDPSSIPLPEMR